MSMLCLSITVFDDGDAGRYFYVCVSTPPMSLTLTSTLTTCLGTYTSYASPSNSEACGVVNHLVRHNDSMLIKVPLAARSSTAALLRRAYGGIDVTDLGI